MKKQLSFLLPLTAFVALTLSVAACNGGGSGGGGSGSTFTLTGIPSEFNGKYIIYVSNIQRPDFGRSN